LRRFTAAAAAAITPPMAIAEPLPESAGTLADPETGGTLIIDLAAIAANWRALARRALTVECAAVVKANAYGMGIEPVTATLAAAGCKTFFVADLAEARRVRTRAPDAIIYVLDGCTPEGSPAFVELNARPVINSMTELAEWDAFVTARNWQGGAALQVDTGMNRLGISPDEAAALAPRTQTENHGIALLMSHLACAELPDHPLTVSQIKLFRDLRALYRGIPASLANSSGIFLGDSALCDLVRPGAALYGVNPTPGKPNPMQGVVELSGRILQIRSVAEGQTVGYGATWTAKRASRLAVVAVGYADGLMRAASASDSAPGGMAIVAQKLCPFAGRISMDLVCVDVTDLPDGAVHRGDVATSIGGGIGIDDFAAAAGTIGYEVLTRLGMRCHLVYRGLDPNP
jgi:alanine racemase